VRRGDTVDSLPYLSSESRPARLTAGSSTHQEPDDEISSSVSAPWAGIGSRSPVGELPATAEGNAARLIPMSSFQKEWSAYLLEPREYTDLVIAPGGATFTSAQFEADLVALGYGGGVVMPTSWWLDVTVLWARHAPAEVITRRAVVRTAVERIDDSSGTAVFSASPALPCYPMIASSSSLQAVFWAGDSLAFRRTVADGSGGTDRDAFVRNGASGITFESVCGWRRSTSSDLDGLLTSLQAECLGSIVDADSAQVGRKKPVYLSQNTARAVPGITYTSAAHPSLGYDEPLHSDSTTEAVVTGDAITLSPALSARDAFVRAEAPSTFTYYAFSQGGVTDPVSSENYLSERPPKGSGDARMLSAHAPRTVFVGLGLVPAAPVSISLPQGTQSESQAIVVLDEATGLWEEVADASSVPLAGGGVVPTPGFCAAYTNRPWAAALTWKDDSDLSATLVPASRVSAQSGARYQGQLTDTPSVADEVLTLPGTPISARFGSVSPGEAAMASSGRVAASSAWLDAANLVGTSRLPAAEQGREVSLTFVCMGPWEGRDGVWTLVESPSHILTLVTGATCALRAYERDLLTDRRVLRASVSIPFPAPGRRYRASLQVDPNTRSVGVVWLQADSDTDADPTYTSIASLPVTVPLDDPYPYPRALDGYPLTGATIRIGRPFPPVMTTARSAAAYVDTVETYHAGVSTTENWPLGSLPLAFISATADALTP
jgi:hypothetical protein